MPRDEAHRPQMPLRQSSTSGETSISFLVPGLGLVGTIITIPLLLWHLYSKEFGVYLTAVGIAMAVITIELLYFEREWIITEAKTAQ